MVTGDAQHAGETMDAHREVARQIALADRTVITKLDLLEMSTDLSARLADQIARAMQVLRGMPLQKAPGVAESLDWAMALLSLHRDHLDAGTMEQPDYITQQQPPFMASAARLLEHNPNGVHGASSSGQAVAVHQGVNMPVGTAEDPSSLDWSYWGLQNLFPQDNVPIGNELMSDWFL